MACSFARAISYKDLMASRHNGLVLLDLLALHPVLSRVSTSYIGCISSVWSCDEFPSCNQQHVCVGPMQRLDRVVVDTLLSWNSCNSENVRKSHHKPMVWRVKPLKTEKKCHKNMEPKIMISSCEFTVTPVHLRAKQNDSLIRFARQPLATKREPSRLSDHPFCSNHPQDLWIPKDVPG